MTTQEENFIQKFTSLTTAVHSNQPLLKAFLQTMHFAFNKAIASRFKYLIKTESATCLLFGNEVNHLQFGFFHLPTKPEERIPFWESICAKARELGTASLAGPIQASTYFPYRFITESDGRPFFDGEYFSQDFAHDFMMGQNPSKVLYFRTGERDRFDGVMAVSKPYFDKASEMGFTIQAHSSVSPTLFSSVFQLIGKIFGSNWSFQQISEEETKLIYTSEFGKNTRLMLHTYHLNDQMIGFCRYVEHDEKTIICKTLGLLPEYQKMGLGNAGVYTMHADAKRLGYSHMYYALIYDGNRVQQNMPKDDSVIFRKYASYEFEL